MVTDGKRPRSPSGHWEAPSLSGASVKPPALASENASTPDFELSVTQRNQDLNVPRGGNSAIERCDNKETVILREKPHVWSPDTAAFKASVLHLSSGDQGD